MGEEFITNNDKLEFKELVLEHLRRILEHTKNEFRQKTKHISGGQMGTDTVIIEETSGKVYIQMVEQLSYILKPYFDNKIKEKYKTHIKIIRLNSIDYAENYGKELKKSYKLIYGEEANEISYKIIRKILIIKQIKIAKLLFIELNMLLKRVNYLKGLIYGEEEENNN